MCCKLNTQRGCKDKVDTIKIWIDNIATTIQMISSGPQKAPHSEAPHMLRPMSGFRLARRAPEANCYGPDEYVNA